VILGSGASKKLLARCGGEVASPAKRMAARQNALKGGRPPKERGHALAVLTHCIPPEFAEIHTRGLTGSRLEESHQVYRFLGRCFEIQALHRLGPSLGMQREA
jgi:hypothetical protein